MKNSIIIITLIFIACTRGVQNNEVIIRLYLCDKNTLCINIYNNTNKAYYFPEAKGLPAGLKVFLISDKSKVVDISDKAKILSSQCYSEKEYTRIEKCCKLSDDKKFLSNVEIDSIASSIVSEIQNRDERMLVLTLNRIKRLLKESIFIGPNQCYSDYFPLSDSIKNQKLVIFYTYPYPYPVITTGPTALSQEQIEYNKMLMDSLHFDYPKTIRGYLQYRKLIYSKPIFINN